MSSSHFSGNSGSAGAMAADGSSAAGVLKHDQRRSPMKPEETGETNDMSQSSAGRIAQPEQFRKVFIGGLNYRTTEMMLRDYFSAYGEIVDCVVMQDQNGRSRGFGFVTYSKSSMVDELMRNRPHLIDRREVDVKRAMPKESGTPEIRLAVKKIFIGAIREGISESDLKDYFGKYGAITDCVVMRDSNGLLRGFGFVEFDDCDPVDRIVLEKHHQIKGQSLDVKKAVPKKLSDGGPRRPPGGPSYASSGYPNGGGPYSSRPYPGESLGFYGRGGSDYFGRGSASSSRSAVPSGSAGYSGGHYDRSSGGSAGYDSFHGPSRSRDSRDAGPESTGPSRPFYGHSRHQTPYDGKEYPSRSRGGGAAGGFYGSSDRAETSSFAEFGSSAFNSESSSRYGEYGSHRGSFHPSRFSREGAKSPPGYGGGSMSRGSYGSSNPWSGSSERYSDRYSSRREEESQYYDHRRGESPIRDMDRMNAASSSGSRMRASDRGANQDRSYGSNGGAFMHDYLSQRSMPSRVPGSGFPGGSGTAGPLPSGDGYGSGGGSSRYACGRPASGRYGYGTGGGSYMDSYESGKSGLGPYRSNTEGPGSYWSS